MTLEDNIKNFRLAKRLVDVSYKEKLIKYDKLKISEDLELNNFNLEDHSDFYTVSGLCYGMAKNLVLHPIKSIEIYFGK